MLSLRDTENLLRRQPSGIARITLFWRFQIIGWVLFSLVTIPVKTDVIGSASAAIAITLVREPLGLFLSTVMRQWFLRLGLNCSDYGRLVRSVLLICLITGAIDWLILLSLARVFPLLETVNQSPLSIFYLRCFIYLLWSVIYFWIKEQRLSRQQEVGLRMVTQAGRHAELLMLRSQVNPHFLFNAFSTILADLELEKSKMAPVVAGLADYFRYSLSSRDNALVPLGEEYDAMMGYLSVERARFLDSLILDCHIDDGVRGLWVPGILLQPLVENAIHFGFRTSPMPLRLRIRVTGGSNGGATVEVANSGTWVEEIESRDANDDGGFGLAILRRRLALHYPPAEIPRLALTAADGEVRILLNLETPTLIA